jgi:sugar/nucleoside kinase (ribokinase family)
VSGESAASHGGSCLNYAANVSRLDLQVTTLDAPVGYDWTEYARGRARADARCITNQTKLLRIEGDPDGRTFYIGSRKSERFFRVYDKHAESKGTWPAGSWRWEVEYKGGRAAVVASYIRASGPGAESIRAIVAAAWLSYGVIMPGGTIPANWRDKSPKDQTDDAKRLEWLKTSIAPMVRRMLESHDPNVILGVLGLGAYRINEDGTNVREEY